MAVQKKKQDMRLPYRENNITFKHPKGCFFIDIKIKIW